ncbi:MAG: metallophosphoesterase [Verrucomicrobiota bacterium]
MSLFLLTFFLIYGSTHAYVFLKAKAALAFGWGTGIPVVLAMSILVCAPIITYYLSRQGYESAARAVAYVGYVWMGILFFLTWLNLAADLARLLLWVPARLGLGGNALSFLGGRTAFLCIVGAALILSAYSVREADRIQVTRTQVLTDRLPPSVPRLRIAQISDLHLGLIHRNGKARDVAGLVARERPDLFVSTGDLVDGQLDGVEGLARIFRDVPAPKGKYAVPGNHEYYAGIDRSLAFTRMAGFTVLRDETALDDGLRIAGVDDPARVRFEGPGPPEVSLLENRSDGRFTLLLKHRPAIDPASAGRFDLQLSGHTHDGQIWPFRLLTRFVYPLLGGDHPVPGGGLLHVSRGTGTWGPPMRFLAPPEITIIDVVGRR